MQPSKALLIFSFSALLTSLGHAAVFHVDTTLDSSAAAHRGCVLLGPVLADCSLRGAILEANARAGADIIVLAAGATYQLTIGASAEDAGLEGDLDITSDVVIKGFGAVIDAAGIDRAVHVLGGVVELRNLTITGGLLDDIVSWPNRGGGLNNQAGTVTLHNVVVEGNSAWDGGGIAQDGGSLSLTAQTSIRYNEAKSYQGGGLWIASGSLNLTEASVEGNQSTGHGGGISFAGDNLDIVDSTLSSNISTSAAQGDGGAIILWQGDTTISGSTFANNVAEYGGGLTGHGGAIALISGTLTASDSEFIDNESGYHGGAIYSEGTIVLDDVLVDGNTAVHEGGGLAFKGGSAELESVVVKNNSASRGGGLESESSATIKDSLFLDNSAITGGGIYQRALSSGTSTLLLIDSEVTTNFASSGSAGLHNAGGNATMELDNCIVAWNNAQGVASGGGISNVGDASGSPVLTVTDSDVHLNYTSTHGGGIYNKDAYAYIKTSEIWMNVAGEDGGGLYSSGGSSDGLLVVERSSVIGNIAIGHGGGLAVFGGGSDPTAESFAVLNNSTLSGNTASRRGGGLAIREGNGIPARPASARLYNVTITDNQSLNGPGGAVAVSQGTAHIYNSIVEAPQQLECATLFGGTITSEGHNIDAGASCGFFTAGDQQNTAPLLDQLANNGGPTRTHRTQVGSPALNAGNPAGCPGDRDGDGIIDPTPLLGDQRGLARNGVCDVGSFE